MSVKIIIQNTPIDIPTAGESPNWAPAITEALQTLATSINSAIGAYDVAPQVLNIDDFPNSSNQTIDNLFFPPSEVLSSHIWYAVKRQTLTNGVETGQILTEEGTLEIVYHENGASGQKWEIVRVYTGEANIQFQITDAGQVTFSTSSIGSNFGHTGIISYRALSTLNS